MIFNDLPNSEIRKYIEEFMPYGPVARMMEEYIIDATPVLELVYKRNEIKEFRELIRKFRLFVEGKEEEAEMKRYKITVSVSLYITAEDEDMAVKDAENELINHVDEMDDFFEVEEVID